MRKQILTIGAALVIGIGPTSLARALPSAGAEPAGEVNASSTTDEARAFCYNRSSGRFLHWGSCYGGVVRVYCKNRYTGRFLHWGSCY